MYQLRTNQRISITDGQIFLQLSYSTQLTSRVANFSIVCGAAQTKVIKKLSGVFVPRWRNTVNWQHLLSSLLT